MCLCGLCGNWYIVHVMWCVVCIVHGVCNVYVFVWWWVCDVCVCYVYMVCAVCGMYGIFDGCACVL